MKTIQSVHHLSEASCKLMFIKQGPEIGNKKHVYEINFFKIRKHSSKETL